jgi:hypothetical protein
MHFRSVFSAFSSALIAFVVLRSTPMHAQAVPVFHDRHGRISGQVTDPEGLPIGGVVVSITTTTFPTFSKQVRSDRNGKWAALLIDAIPEYHYHFETPGYAVTEQDKKVPFGNLTSNSIHGTARTARLDIQLQRQQ